MGCCSFTIVHNAAVNGTSLHVDITFWFLLDKCLKAGLMKLVVNSVRYCDTDFRMAVQLYLHHQQVRGLSLQHLRVELSVFLIKNILVGCRIITSQLLNFIFLMTCDVENLFMVLFVICWSSFVKCLFKSFCLPINGLFVFLLKDFFLYFGYKSLSDIFWKGCFP